MRLLLVEDERELADLLVAALKPAGFVVDHVTTIADAEAALAAGRYDIAVLDLRLPDGDGLDLLKRHRANGLSIPVLILTARDNPCDRVRGLEEGGDDYVVKPFHFDEVVARLRALLRRPNQALSVHLVIGNVDFNTADLKVMVATAPLQLSRRELGLLELFMRRAGRVLSKEVIEHAVYSFDDDIDSNALEVLMHRLRRKLTDAGASTRIHTLRGIGYLMDDLP
ncbi:response regulator [Ancylobacter defluvii]|uniref:DNA-binding response regulator n=1 Tax=Ancylobacter defluvii TaxID=1282440 RepID=A0A9W6JYX1_9HYPH|nr:response regulator transcription factor [Ancylobacter defluvii]MBS7586520.1 response regulator transcription factor [Ancylobacter defluvii]GLK85807.1 DNA-binding response regulator [Ancylobacter defluvii]